MQSTLPILDQISIASPCQASWDEMKGDGRKRFCSQCSLHVYNLSEMSRTEAAKFIAQAEGRTCVRFFRRADGTLLTRDCPVGVRSVRQRLIRAVAALAGMLLALTTGTLLASRTKGQPGANRSQETIFSRWIQPQREVSPLMGDLVVPIPTPSPPTGSAQEPLESAP
jgi:hypothetical protein